MHREHERIIRNKVTHSTLLEKLGRVSLYSHNTRVKDVGTDKELTGAPAHQGQKFDVCTRESRELLIFLDLTDFIVG
ncbi:hypothetical protein KIPE111705_22775 [Kibdelosporangium persicum]